MTLRTRSSHGQAMTEFIILLAGVIVPFLLLMPMIAKYQDAQHQTQMASRYVAFEARTQSDDANNWRPDDVLAREVQNRFFGEHGSRITSNPSSPATGPWNWTDPTHRALLPNPSAAVAIRTGPNGQGSGTTNGFDPSTDAFASAAFQGGMEPRYLGLKGRGLFTATVEVNLNRLPTVGPGFMGSSFAPFDAMNMRLSARTTTLTSPWTAKDPAQVLRQMGTREGDVFAWVFPSQGLTLTNDYPQYTTDRIVKIVSDVEATGKIKGPEIGRLEFWQDMPAPDRLKPN
ncbi:hypothetical protein [Ideonella sp.]|jgi:hypothetical protein|uniref:hypothetical protein n=1 Tax=Ideonella sp. TaxID=1929293 RepID=UPI0037C07F6E